MQAKWASSNDGVSTTNNVAGRAGAPSFRGKRSALLCVLLAVVTMASYSRVAHNGFINFDDDRYLTTNATVQSGLSWTTLKWAFTTRDVANWHPLTWIFFTLDWQLFHNHAAGHHYVSVLFHVVNAMLLFLLLEGITGFNWRSLIVALLFAIHPMNVETAAWASELKSVLSMMFFLLALMAYGRYSERPSIRRYSLVALCFALGLLAKPQIITLPFVLLLWDYWPLERFRSATNGGVSLRFAPASAGFLIIEKIPLLIIAAADALITMYAQRGGYAGRTLAEYSLHARLTNAVVSYVKYIVHAVWPLRLSPTYSHPGDSIPMRCVVAACAFLIAVSVAVAMAKRRYLVSGWLWFLGTLVPMIGLVQVGDQAMADRYAYIPLIGLFWMAAWGFAELVPASHFSQNRQEVGHRRLPLGWSVVLVCLIFTFYGALTWRQIGCWHDSERLWRYALSIDERDWIAHANLGRELKSQNRPEEAIAEFTITRRLHPLPVVQLVMLAQYELRFNHIDDAMALCRDTLAATQDRQLRALAYVELGLANVRLGHPPEAKQNFEQALRLEPRNSDAIMGLGLLAERDGDFAGAANSFAEAIRSQPTDLGYFLLAVALEKGGRRAEAMTAFRQAQVLSPDFRDMLQWAHMLLPQ